MQPKDWPTLAAEYVTAIERECAADKKKFWNENDGSARAKAAIAHLNALRSRLEKYVRA